MKINFSKLHGLGNDFIIINNLELQHRFSIDEIQYLANRRFGIGCDQVLIIDRATDGVSDYFYRIYNSDGSEAGQCGNGARCFIYYLVKHGITKKQKLILQTSSRQIAGQLVDGDLVEVNMGNAEFDSALIPLILPTSSHYSLEIAGEEIKFAALSMGNPHAVLVVKNLADLSNDINLQAIGVGLQNSGIFPLGVNVNFMYVENDTSLHLRTYERGSGFTLACGSGACASAVVAIRSGLVQQPVTVKMSGGELIIHIDNEAVIMTGAAIEVFNGQIEL